ncbi:EF-hand domain-containing protein [Sphingobium mellinum]|uniref:EF-hand domain-containing protein n=1 Tax=Sphingobium mellinum TaxID=1387166 RepID=UPI0030EF1979
MIRALIVSSLLLTAAPVLAQEATAPAASAQQQQPASPAESVASIVDSEFPAYDANSDGQLDKAEFSRWMVALKDQEMKTTGKSLTPAEVSTWANGAFVTADADKSISVSKPELIRYLSTGAS